MSVFVGRSAMHIANADDLTTNINGVQQLGSKNDKKYKTFRCSNQWKFILENDFQSYK